MESTMSEQRVAAGGAPPAGFPATSRFDYVATLGRGGMGCVYEAIDRERGIAVALKTLLEMSPQRILYLKREFRALRDLHHPNLASLGDLVEAGGTWFFTMELLRGPDLTGYVRGTPRASLPAPAASNGSTTALSWSHEGALEPGDADPVVPPPPRGERPAPAYDDDHLRDALRQLARGLMALHAAGLVHRDIKPSNILVERDRVVLLDFGIVGRLEGEPHAGSVAGTWPYAAPEQLLGEPLSPAVDAYALGMCLFEAMVGRLPLRGRPRPSLVASRPAPDPRDFVRDLPDDLATLCTRLLAPEPRQRPTMRDVLEVLDARGPVIDASVVAVDPAFVGRAEELASLDRAFEASRYGEPVCVLVHGESGVGKTRLVQELLVRARRNRPTLVALEARCHAREVVPYGAIDGIVDGLAHHLSAPGAPTLDGRLPAGIDALVRVFPVLATVPAIARARTTTALDDDAESRRAAFAALRELLVLVAEEHVMILAIDDLHWAEPDSLSLLGELFAPGRAVPALLVATLQDLEGAPHAMLRGSGCRVESIQLRPLDEHAAAELARSIGAALAIEAAVEPEVIARDAGGHPLFIAELVHHACERDDRATRPVDLDAALRARIAALPAEARNLLEVVTVAASPIAHELAATAAALDTASYADPMTRLARANLVRVTGVRRADHIEPYHKRVQAVVASTVAAERRRDLHHTLATALDERGGAPEALAVHYELAGVRDRAAHHAARAAERAVSALAFERAASWYRKALELTGEGGDHRRRLAVALADVLVDAGQPLDAAEAYRAAATIGT
ncbi:MAG TPA: AAA family ATPase, partial [Kofleriaceae bacterium]|nr:AAA family ATPase [Kofleriaceae bacterium]